MTARIHHLTSLRLYFIPLQTRMPLKFGTETLRSTTCLRVAMGVVDEENHVVEGWGETPLSVQWVWPSDIAYERRYEVLKQFCSELASAWMGSSIQGHPLEAGHDFQQFHLVPLFDDFNSRKYPGLESAGLGDEEPMEKMPWLAALVCNSAFDIALHDAFGRLAGRPVYETYGPEFLGRDLAYFLEPAKDSVSFASRFPIDYLLKKPQDHLLAWHLVGGLDPLENAELTGAEPNDGYPILLGDWIRQDGLKCLKIKLRGIDSGWDFQRLVKVGETALPLGIEWFTADFNCTVRDPE
jgi:hypothetical protein